MIVLIWKLRPPILRTRSLKERLENDFGFTVSLKYKDTDDNLINLREIRGYLWPLALRPAVAENRMTVEVPRQTPPTAPASLVVPPGSSAVVVSAVPPDVFAVVRLDVLQRWHSGAVGSLKFAPSAMFVISVSFCEFISSSSHPPHACWLSQEQYAHSNARRAVAVGSLKFAPSDMFVISVVSFCEFISSSHPPHACWLSQEQYAHSNARSLGKRDMSVLFLSASRYFWCWACAARCRLHNLDVVQKWIADTVHRKGWWGSVMKSLGRSGYARFDDNQPIAITDFLSHSWTEHTCTARAVLLSHSHAHTHAHTQAPLALYF